MRDIAIIKRELPVDVLEFFYLTPLPGSADHKALWSAGVPMDPDMNRYDLNHVTTAHPQMSRPGVGAGLSPGLAGLLQPRSTWRPCCAEPPPGAAISAARHR